MPYSCCHVFAALTGSPENPIQLNVTFVLDRTRLVFSFSHLVPAGGLPCSCGLLRCREVKASRDRASQQFSEMLVVWLFLVAQSFHVKEE